MQAYAKAVEQAVVHYGDTTLTFLSNLQKADDRGQGLTYISAVAVEEKSVWDYNKGNPSGDPTTLGTHAKPKIPLVAIYPKEGTLLSDSPYVVLQAPWVDAPVKAAAKDFLSYVRSAGPQKRFAAAAFRRFDGKPGGRHHAGERPAADRAEGRPEPARSPGARAGPGPLERAAQGRQGAARHRHVGVDGRRRGQRREQARARQERRAQGPRPVRRPRRRRAVVVLHSAAGYHHAIPAAGAVRAHRDDQRLRCASRSPLWNPTAVRRSTPPPARAFQVISAACDSTRINAVVLLTDGNEYPADNDLASLQRELAPRTPAAACGSSRSATARTPT